MTQNPQRLMLLLDDLVACPPQERSERLAAQCGNDADLRRELSSLLAAHERAEAASPEPPVGERAGDSIGSYKLLERIGEGGFGTVWMAEQASPVRRKVALKILKWGMDTRQVVARFEAERQALALMDHPNIARIYDGGATPSGRPYFVMELVRGLPLLKYCDEAKLSPRERVELFQHVCEAVQHAHQKGVIHRDLKPSNVLVTMHDGRPVPKVIDFGIAKATSAQLTDKTMFTGFHQVLGTLEYMAPEQAERSGLDVDTRADIYSLGVVLYELLTGVKPLDLQQALTDGFDALLRRIREVDPQKPSTRVSTLGERLIEVSRHRRVNPGALGRLMRGDLDWIVLKAMEKDRTRRYATAVALSEDLGRHLRHEAVAAGPPGSWYRLRKYSRRHRVAVGTSLLVGVSLLAGTGIAWSGYAAATRGGIVARLAAAEATAHAKSAEREARKANRVVDLMKSMLGGSRPSAKRPENYTARELLDDFAGSRMPQLDDEPEVEAVLRKVMASCYLALSLPRKAEPHSARVLALQIHAHGDGHPATVESLLHHATTMLEMERADDALGLLRRAENAIDGDSEAATEQRISMFVLLSGAHLLREELEASEHAAREALALRRTQLPGNRYSMDECLAQVGFVLAARGRLDQGEEMLRAALSETTRRATAGANEDGVVRAALAMVLQERGCLVEARAEYDASLPLLRRVYGSRGLRVGDAMLERAHCEMLLRNYTAAEQGLQEALDLQRTPGDRPRAVANVLTKLACLLNQTARHGRALEVATEAMDLMIQRVDEQSALPAMLERGYALHRTGDTPAGIAVLRRAIDVAKRAPEQPHVDLVPMGGTLGIVLFEAGDVVAAETTLRDAIEVMRELAQGGRPMRPIYLDYLVRSVEAQGRSGEAEPWVREWLEQPAHARDPDSAVLMHRLGLFALAAGQHARAAHWAHRATELRRQLDLLPSLEQAAGLLNLGYALQRGGDPVAAEAPLREALALYRDLEGDSFTYEQHSLTALVDVLLAQDKTEDAIAVVGDGIARLRPALQDKQGELGGVLATLGNLLIDKSPATAEPLLRECLDIRSRVQPREWRYFSALALLGRALAAQGRLAAAEPLLVEACQSMQPPPDAQVYLERARQCLANLYERTDRPADAARWRGPLPGR